MTGTADPHGPPGTAAVATGDGNAGPPAGPPTSEPLPRLFLRFLRFGLMAWGGPVAQIAMIRQELVDRERWLSPEKFSRVLAVYQVLPGPEAHELCCYFGMVARGRVGSVLAGLGFMLPGFLLMLALSWAYVEIGLNGAVAAAIFAGMQPAVAALVVRAVHRIGEHALRPSPWLLWIAAGSAVATVAGLPFWIPLTWGAAAWALARSGRRSGALLVTAAVAAASLLWVLAPVIGPGVAAARVEAHAAAEPSPGPADRPAPGVLALFWSGLKAGLLTFGGAYTAIPFLRRDAVERGGWATEGQFLDGLALGGVIPAPLVIFSTFLGYLGGGFPGALAMTAGMFLPAFSFSLIGHDLIAGLVNRSSLHALLDGVTAAVIGLMAATAIGLLASASASPRAAVIFLLALGALYVFKGRAVVPLVVLGAAVAGVVLAGVAG